MDVEVDAKEVIAEQGLAAPCENAEFVTEDHTQIPGAAYINWHCDCHGWYFRAAN